MQVFPPSVVTTVWSEPINVFVPLVVCLFAEDITCLSAKDITYLSAWTHTIILFSPESVIFSPLDSRKRIMRLPLLLSQAKTCYLCLDTSSQQSPGIAMQCQQDV